MDIKRQRGQTSLRVLVACNKENSQRGRILHLGKFRTKAEALARSKAEAEQIAKQKAVVKEAMVEALERAKAEVEEKAGSERKLKTQALERVKVDSEEVVPEKKEYRSFLFLVDCLLHFIN